MRSAQVAGRRGWLVAAAVVVALAAAPLAARPALAQGTIKGSVRFAGGAVDDRKVAITIDQYICGKEKDSERLVVSADRGI